MEDCKSDLLRRILELSGGHIQNFELIKQLMHDSGQSTVGSLVEYVHEPNMTTDDPTSYENLISDSMIYYNIYNSDV